MNKYKKLVVGIVGVIILINASTLLYERFQQQQIEKETVLVNSKTTNEEKTKAIDCELTDQEGNKINLSSKFGKPIVLNFWASWCPPCRQEMKIIQKLYTELKDEVEFVMVNITDGTKETKQGVQDFIKESDYTFPVYYDLDQDAVFRYGVTVLPTTFFINKEGYIIANATGGLNEETFRSGIGMFHQ